MPGSAEEPAFRTLVRGGAPSMWQRAAFPAATAWLGPLSRWRGRSERWDGQRVGRRRRWLCRTGVAAGLRRFGAAGWSANGKTASREVASRVVTSRVVTSWEAAAGAAGGAWKTRLATWVAAIGCALASAAGWAKSGIRKGRVVGGGSSRLGCDRAARCAEKGWIDEVAMGVSRFRGRIVGRRSVLRPHPGAVGRGAKPACRWNLWAGRQSRYIRLKGLGMRSCREPKSTSTEVSPVTPITRPSPYTSCVTRSPTENRSCAGTAGTLKGLLGRRRRGTADSVITSSMHVRAGMASRRPPRGRAVVHRWPERGRTHG